MHQIQEERRRGLWNFTPAESYKFHCTCSRERSLFSSPAFLCLLPPLSQWAFSQGAPGAAAPPLTARDSARARLVGEAPWRSTGDVIS
jgi:hypothetical protein